MLMRREGAITLALRRVPIQMLLQVIKTFVATPLGLNLHTALKNHVAETREREKACAKVQEEQASLSDAWRGKIHSSAFAWRAFSQIGRAQLQGSQRVRSPAKAGSAEGHE